MPGTPWSEEDLRETQSQGFLSRARKQIDTFLSQVTAPAAPAVPIPDVQAWELPSLQDLSPWRTEPEPQPVVTPPVATATTRPAAMPTAPVPTLPSTGEAIGAISITSGTPATGQRGKADQYRPLIEQVSREEGVPFDVLAGILDTEDSGEASVSPAGARGVMQVVPGQGFDLPGENAADPLTSIRQGARALKEKHRMAGGDWDRAGQLYFGVGTDAGGMDDNTYLGRYRANRAKYQGATPAATTSPVDDVMSLQARPEAHTPDDGHDHADEYEVAFGFNQEYGTSQFNPAIPRHRGVDLVVRGAKQGGRGKPVKAFRGGTVVAVTKDPNGGNGIILQDDQGLYHRYFHFDDMSVKQGQRIEPGQEIGVLGASGTEGFPHVHFEVSRGINGDPMDQLIDPQPYMRTPAGQRTAQQQRAPGTENDPIPMASGDEPPETLIPDVDWRDAGIPGPDQGPSGAPIRSAAEMDADRAPTVEDIERLELPDFSGITKPDQGPGGTPIRSKAEMAPPEITLTPPRSPYAPGQAESMEPARERFSDEDDEPTLTDRVIEGAQGVAGALIDIDRPRRIVEEAAARIGMRFEPRKRPPLKAPESTIDPDLDRGTAISNAARRGVSGAQASLLDAGAETSRMLGLPSAAEAFEDWADSTIKSQDPSTRRRRTKDALDGPFGVAEAVVESAPSILPTVLGAVLAAGGVLTGNPALAAAGATTARVGLAAGGLSAFGSQARELRPEVAAGRISQGMANAVAIGAGLVEVATEKLFPGIDKALVTDMGAEVMQRMLADLRSKGLAGAAKNVLREAGQEGVEEMVAESYGVAVDAAFKAKAPTLAEAARRIGAAGVTGAAIGGGLATGTQAVEAVADSQARARVKSDVEGASRAVGAAAADIGREAAERAVLGNAPRMIQETGGGSERPARAEDTPTKHEFSSTQLDLPKRLAERVQAYGRNAIADDDLADDGRESSPHVTVKYGLTTGNAEDVRKIVEKHGPITVKLGRTSVFPAAETGGKYDVVKVDVDSPELRTLNAELAKLPNEDRHPEYTPHVTLAYVRPGAGKNYAGMKDLEGESVTIDELTFSSKSGERVTIKLKGEASKAGPKFNISYGGTTVAEVPRASEAEPRDLPKPRSQEAPAEGRADPLRDPPAALLDREYERREREPNFRLEAYREGWADMRAERKAEPTTAHKGHSAAYMRGYQDAERVELGTVRTKAPPTEKAAEQSGPIKAGQRAIYTTNKGVERPVTAVKRNGNQMLVRFDNGHEMSVAFDRLTPVSEEAPTVEPEVAPANTLEDRILEYLGGGRRTLAQIRQEFSLEDGEAGPPLRKLLEAGRIERIPGSLGGQPGGFRLLKPQEAAPKPPTGTVRGSSGTKFERAQASIKNGTVMVTMTLGEWEGWPADKATITFPLSAWRDGTSGPAVFENRQLIRERLAAAHTDEQDQAGRWDRLQDHAVRAVEEARKKLAPPAEQEAAEQASDSELASARARWKGKRPAYLRYRHDQVQEELADPDLPQKRRAALESDARTIRHALQARGVSLEGGRDSLVQSDAAGIERVARSATADQIRKQIKLRESVGPEFMTEAIRLDIHRHRLALAARERMDAESSPAADLPAFLTREPETPSSAPPIESITADGANERNLPIAEARAIATALRARFPGHDVQVVPIGRSQQRAAIRIETKPGSGASVLVDHEKARALVGDGATLETEAESDGDRGRAPGPEQEQPGGADRGALADARQGPVSRAEEERRAGDERAPEGRRDDQGRPEPPAGRADRQRSVGSGDARSRPSRPEVTPAKRLETAPAVADVVMTDDDLTGRTPVERWNDNIAALRVLMTLRAEARSATIAEQRILARYSGFGDSAFEHAFRPEERKPNPAWKKRGDELRALVSEAEYQAIRESRINANYTSAEVVAAMWGALQRMGLTGPNLRVLDPSAGSGRFFGFMPPELAQHASRWMVELDTMTGELAQALFPQASVQITGFEQARIPADSFDLAISNVPFSDAVRIGKGQDPSVPANLGRLALHNYFFFKALQALRPGGVVAFVTTHNTLDARTSKRFREYLAGQADFLGAIRLPQDAFVDTAVTTDIVFLKKREPGAAAGTTAWTETEQRTGADGTEYDLNEYFIDNPEMALGQHSTTEGRGLYRGTEYRLVKDPGLDMQVALNAAVGLLPADVFTPSTPDSFNPDLDAVREAHDVKPGAYVVKPGKLGQRRLLVHDPVSQALIDPPNMLETAKARVIRMMDVRDAARTVLARQLDPGASDASVKQAQVTLAQAYDGFVREYGPLSETYNQGLLRTEPDAPLLRALERRETLAELRKRRISEGRKITTGAQAGKTEPKAWPKLITAADLKNLKMPIFTERVITPVKKIETAETPADALAIVLNERGAIDAGRMSELLGGTPEAEILDALVAEGVLFHDPDGGHRLAEEYLSGDVVAKLARAEEAAETDGQFSRNVEALKTVQPTPLKASEVSIRLGAPWVPEADVNDFMQQLLEGEKPPGYRYLPALGQWTREERYYGFAVQRALNNGTYGTDRIDAITIIDRMLNGKDVVVRTPDPDDPKGNRTIADAEATQKAQAKAREIRTAWTRWLRDNPERLAALVDLYNDRYNREVPRAYDGRHLTFPGMAQAKPPRAHQRNVVWRVIQNGTVLMAHEVGAGKTIAMAASAMELRRLGLSKKNLFVVPNHLVGQFAQEFLSAYPSANVLVPRPVDFAAKNRQELMARIATGDYDAIVVAQSQFTLLPISQERQQAMIQAELNELEAALREEEAQRGYSRQQSQSEKELIKAQKRLKSRLLDMQGKIAERQDKMLTFEDLGIDALFADEADMYKNLQFVTRKSRVKGLPNAKSQRAFDMHAKVSAIREGHGGRGVVFATGTPISNTIAELWTMLRYLAPEALDRLGAARFDAWADTFGDTITQGEMTVTGKFQMVTSFTQFQNAAELNKLFQVVADIVTEDDMPELAKYKPKLRGGERIDVVIPPTPELRAYMASIEERANNLKNVDPTEDNMLKISSDSRKAALDVRLVNPRAPEDASGKIEQAAERIAAVWTREKRDRGTQIVFLDMGTPKALSDEEIAKLEKAEADSLKAAGSASEDAESVAEDEQVEVGGLTAEEQRLTSDVYNRIKAKLVARGIPADQIAFIHDAKTKAQKQKLFDDVNDGTVRVILGSTEKLGAGTNVQRRLVALHHIDAPWRPRDVEQREGRILRQGNEVYGPTFKDGEVTDEGRGVEVYRYLTEGSFDSAIWSGIMRKARAIKLMVRRHVTARTIEDADEFVLSAAQAAALATGNPDIIRYTEMQAELGELEAGYAAHQDASVEYERIIKRTPFEIAELEAEIAALTKARTEIDAEAAKGYEVTVKGQRFSKRETATFDALLDAIRRAYGEKDWTPIATYRGSRFEARMTWGNLLERRLVRPDGTVLGSWQDRLNDISGRGDLQAIERASSEVNTSPRLMLARQMITRKRSTRESAERQKAQAGPFEQLRQLERLRADVPMIEAKVTAPPPDRGDFDRSAAAAAQESGEAVDWQAVEQRFRAAEERWRTPFTGISDEALDRLMAEKHGQTVPVRSASTAAMPDEEIPDRALPTDEDETAAAPEITPERFAAGVERGRLHQAPEGAATWPGLPEGMTEPVTPISAGLGSEYSLDDVMHFYFNRRSNGQNREQALELGRQEFERDLATEPQAIRDMVAAALAAPATVAEPPSQQQQIVQALDSLKAALLGEPVAPVEAPVAPVEAPRDVLRPSGIGSLLDAQLRGAVPEGTDRTQLTLLTALENMISESKRPVIYPRVYAPHETIIEHYDEFVRIARQAGYDVVRKAGPDETVGLHLEPIGQRGVTPVDSSWETFDPFAEPEMDSEAEEDARIEAQLAREFGLEDEEAPPDVDTAPAEAAAPVAEPRARAPRPPRVRRSAPRTPATEPSAEAAPEAEPAPSPVAEPSEDVRYDQTETRLPEIEAMFEEVTPEAIDSFLPESASEGMALAIFERLVDDGRVSENGEVLVGEVIDAPAAEQEQAPPTAEAAPETPPVIEGTVVSGSSSQPSGSRRRQAGPATILDPSTAGSVRTGQRVRLDDGAEGIVGSKGRVKIHGKTAIVINVRLDDGTTRRVEIPTGGATPPQPPPTPPPPTTGDNPGADRPEDSGDAANAALGRQYGRPMKDSKRLTPGMIEAARRAYVRAMTDDRIDLNLLVEEIEQEHGELPAEFRVDLLARMSPGMAAKVTIDEGLKPHLQGLSEADLAWLDVFLTHMDNLDVARAMGLKAEQATLDAAGPFRGKSWRNLQTERQRLRAFAPGGIAENADKAQASAKRIRSLEKQVQRDEVKHQQTVMRRAARRRGKVESERLFSEGLTVADSHRALGAMARELGARRLAKIQKAATGVWEFNRSLLASKVENDVISQELYDELLARYPHYVPTRIVDFIKDPATGGPAVGKSLSMNDTGLKQNTLEGTTRRRENPLASTYRNAIETEKIIKQNQVALAMKLLIESDPDGLGQEFRPAPEGHSLRDGEGYVAGFEKGERFRYVTGEPMSRALKTISVSPIHPVFRAFMNVWKEMITRFPLFWAYQSIQDAATYEMREQVRAGGNPLAIGTALGDLVVGYAISFRGILSGEYKGEAAAYLKSGGGMAGLSVADRDAPRERVYELTGRKSLWTLAKQLGLFQWSQEISQRIELAPRVASYRRALRRGESEVEATVAGRDVTLDFLRGGYFSRYLNGFLGFFNVGAQASASIPRMWKENRRGFIIMASMWVGIGALLEAAMAGDDEEWEDIPSYIKDRALVFATGGTSTMEDGEPRARFATLPMRELAPLLIVGREVARRFQGKEGRDPLELLLATLMAASPIQASGPADLFGSAFPEIIATPAQLAMDYDWFRGSKIATAAGDERASNLSHWVANAAQFIGDRNETLRGLGTVQPSQVEFATRGVFGHFGRTVGAASDLGKDRGEQDRGPIDTPLVGGLIGRFVTDAGGERLAQAQQEKNLIALDVREELRAAKVNVKIGTVRGTIENVPLHRAEQARYQELANSYSDRELRSLLRSGDFRSARGAARAKLVSEAITRGRQAARQRVLDRIPYGEQERRKRAAEQKAS
jgi:N12 class adenine-specific DNA methylase/murein DD-endopeptidase MepM/ murein hydrolase activator NlpD/2'-5' RNA ligase